MNFLSEYVRPHVIKKDPTKPNQSEITPDILAMKDKLADVLTPMEIKITKSKDSAKNQTRFLLFCKENLCIYNNVQEYIADIPMILTNNTKLVKDINLLLNQAIVNVATNDFIDDEVGFDMSTITNNVNFGIADEQTTTLTTEDFNFSTSEETTFMPTSLTIEDEDGNFFDEDL